MLSQPVSYISGLAREPLSLQATDDVCTLQACDDGTLHEKAFLCTSTGKICNPGELCSLTQHLVMREARVIPLPGQQLEQHAQGLRPQEGV